MKTALITGALGQDGSYLTEHLLGLGYRVFGMVRREPVFAAWTRNLVRPTKPTNIEWLYGDMRDEISLRAAIQKSWPDEVYNLAGQVYVPLSWEMPEETFDVNAGGLARLLKILWEIKKDTKVYQASSSEMYGNHPGACDDLTPMNPTSPYGVSKYAAHRMARVYRGKGLFVSCGILFNHESPRRGREMVTRKIASHVAGWAAGDSAPLVLGSLHSRRDWGFAGEYIKAMHLMLQHSEPGDFVVGTGKSHSVGDFLNTACAYAGLDVVKQEVVLDPRFVRPAEIFDMRADNSKIQDVLHWSPEVDFETLVGLMVKAELEQLVPAKAVTA